MNSSAERWIYGLLLVSLGVALGLVFGYRSGYRVGVAETIDMYENFVSALDGSNYNEQVKKFSRHKRIIDSID